MRSSITLIMVLATVGSASAQESTGATMAPGTGLLPLALNLLLVLGIIVLLGWFFARTRNFRPSQQGGLDIIATRMVGNRERLVVVQVGEDQVMLGITASQITPLHTLREPLPASEHHMTLASGFAAKLNAIRRPDSKEELQS